MLDKKGQRNIANLEAERRQLTNPVELYINACYLLREHLYFEEYDSACEYTRYLLTNHEYMRSACRTYEDGFIFIFYCAIRAAEMFPEKFDRDELHSRLFGGIKENYPETRDAVLIDLYYQLRFHLQTDRFLREVAEVEPRLYGLTAAMESECSRMESEIFKRAAKIAYLRGDSENALRWSRLAIPRSTDVTR